MMQQPEQCLTIYTCKPNWEDMLTCIYTAWSSGKGHKHVRLMLEPIQQYELFYEYIHVDNDPSKAELVADSVCRKISPSFYHGLAYAAMGYEKDRLDVIYRVMILGFARGPEAADMVQYRDVMRYREIRTRVGREAHFFLEFLRFHQVGDVYVSHIEPKSRVAAAIAPHFEDRMPSEFWMIIDDIHREAVIHPKNGHYYMRQLTEEELSELLKTEDCNDNVTDLWKAFFDTIAIKERANARCQMTHFPKWMRKHAIEWNLEGSKESAHPSLVNHAVSGYDNR